eukprot:CAMPEP_0202458720 /NCGR_PEP_ID=MMETSP1360-20130828/27440_1 /ASSEMBLY_ACC=CAM_ASM_000848 /TAXON_ID=515479 /ORGANISM="Licmophora paradoxa, Strain CCMP2313" /LENGTH=92 /DNA_ID=CAMNT_0049079397 /DNA_START=44 /DNA_END=322 /DNA_ORIENTATION=+
MSFFSDIMAPGGGVLLLPFVKVIVGLLLFTTVTIFICGVARIHMAILSFLSSGLLFSLYMFENAYNTVKGRTSSAKSTPSTEGMGRAGEKTD